MQLQQSIAPYFRLRDDSRGITINRLCACGALLIGAVVLHGFRALVMTAMGVLGAALVELAWQFAAKRDMTVTDLSAVVTGMLCAFMLPANASVWLPFFAAAFAVGIVKLPFGGLGRSPFNPEAAGFCFAAVLCATTKSIYNRALLPADQRDIFDGLPDRYFAYIGGSLPGFSRVALSENDVGGVLSPLISLRAGVDPKQTGADLLLGGMLGPMGTTLVLVVAACAVWLFFRRSIAWQASAAFCASLAVLSLLFAWDDIPVLMSPVYDLLTGATLFAAVFLAGDVFTAPHFRTGRLLYGVGCGVLTMVIRRFGSIEGGEIFAVLLMNACSSSIDRLVWWCRERGYSWTANIDKIKKKLRKALKLKSGPFGDIDLDEIDFSVKSRKEDDKDGHEI